MAYTHMTAAHTKERFWRAVFSTLLFVLIYNVVVTIAYGASGAATLSEAAELQGQVAGGDSRRQLIYIGLCGLSVVCMFWQKQRLRYSPLSAAYVMAGVWAMLSFVWAIDPGISLRRSVGMLVVLSAVSICVYNLGARASISVLYAFLAALLIGSLVAVSLSSLEFFSFAVHPANEGDPALIGAWKGLMMHKNVAGAIMVHSAIFFFHHAINRRKYTDWLLFLLSVIFLLETKSKMPFGWFALVLVTGVIYRQLFLQRVRILFYIFNIIVFFACIGGAYAMHDEIYAFFMNPDSLTGRTQIWWSLIPYIERNWLLGSGYGSFWSIGDRSPIYQLALTNFIATIGHSHSGYIEIVLTTGVVGFIIAMTAIAIVPYYRFLSAPREDARLNSMLLSMWFFGLLQNFTEAQIFSPDKQSWMIVVISISIAHCRAMDRKLGNDDILNSTSWPVKGHLYRARRRFYR